MTSKDSTIRDITNPELSSEERAKLRKERREKRENQIDGRLSPRQSPRPFRTQSPTIQPSQDPMLGFPSEYGYVKSLSSSPRSSPTPTHKPPNSPHPLYPKSGTNGSSQFSQKVQSVSESSASSISNGTIIDHTHTKIQTEFPKHTPTFQPYDSRTPRLTRGGTRNSNVVYRKDLNDFSTKDITVVMFPRDTTLERHQDFTGEVNESPRCKKSSDETTPGSSRSSGSKRGLMVVPSGSSETAGNTSSVGTEKPQSNEASEEDPKQSRKVSKRFSFLAKKEEKKGSEKKPPKDKKKKKKEQSEKKLSSGGLSMVSMPNLYHPEEDSLSPDSPSDTTSPDQSKNKYSIFRKKQEKKSSTQKTSWTFQQPNLGAPLSPLHPAVSLQDIAELSGDLPTYDMVAETGSMDLICQGDGNEFNAPVTVFIPTVDLSDEELPDLSRLEDTESTKKEQSSSPLSVGSISIEIPDLPVDAIRCTTTPQPTPNEITGTGIPDSKKDSHGNTDKEHEKGEVLLNKEEMPDTPAAGEKGKDEKNFTRNSGSRRPLRRSSALGKESPFNRRKPSSLRTTPDNFNQTSPSSMSASPSKFSLSSNSSIGESPITTPINQRKKTPSKLGSPVQPRYTVKRVSPSERASKSSPKNSPSSSPSSFRAKNSPANSPTSSPALSRKMSGNKSPLVSSNPKVARSSLTVSASPKPSRKSTETTAKISSNKKVSPMKPESMKLDRQDSLNTRRRKLGITSISSPLAEERGLGEIKKLPNNESKQRITPKRPAPPPPVAMGSKCDKKDEVFSQANRKNDDSKNVSKLPTPHVKQAGEASTPRQTYVYENPNRKSSYTPKSSESSKKKESATYKYSAGSLGKRHSSSTPEDIKTGAVSMELMGDKKSIIEEKSSTPGLRRKSLSKTPSSPTVSSPQKQRNLSAVVSRHTADVAKTSSKDEKQVGRVSPTLDILNPLGSLLTSSPVEKLSSNPSSPPIGSMYARPFSPTSPPLSPEEGEINLTLSPEVPLNSEDKMTVIYRSALLGKSSCDVKPISRMSSNTSLGSPLHEKSGKPLSRTSSPRKSSAPAFGGPSSRQSKKSLTGSPVRKGSHNLQTLSRKPSSGTTHRTIERVQSGTNTMGRPRSASQTGVYHSIRRQAKSSGLLSSSLARQSLKTKKTSVDSIKAKKPLSGLRMSTKSDAAVSPPKPTTVADTPDGTPVNSSNRTTKIPTHKPPLAPDTSVKATKHPSIAVLKGQSSSMISLDSKSKEVRKSIRASKSVESGTKAKLGPTQSVPLHQKPPSGSTLGRSSTKLKISADSVLSKPRSSLRMSRRSSAGTVAKVSQSGSPLHSSSKASSPSHRTLTRTLKRDDTLKAFDHVSSMADKTKLSSVADHKRQIRPRTRHKPSPAHLQMLNKRSDVSSELEANTSYDSTSSGLDPNSYATYMGKKKLDKTALAGLAAKLDFTTVKLRKTGIVEQMMDEKQDSSEGRGHTRILEEPQNNYGVQVTNHPQMLLMIKGRKNVQTRLVEPVPSSINSGDVFILVGSKDLFLWQGREANVLEKARANDIVNRIHQKRELGCRTNGFVHIEEEKGKKEFSKKEQNFWGLLKGKPELKKDISHFPTDESYERGVSTATKVYQYITDGEVGKFSVIHEDTTQPLKIAVLDTKKILLFDFCSEVYVWIGKRTPQAHRKPAMTKARKIYDSGYIPPVFSVNSTPSNSPLRKISTNRQSGRFRSKLHQKHGTGSLRRKTLERKPSKGDLQERPSWSLFARVNEGSETILFREKFVDWPEPGRIIKMKGHESSGEIIKAPPMPELQPADVQEMLKARSKFEGLRLEGENIHRGRGNYQVSRSTFACNRVRSQAIMKYLVKDSDNILLPEEVHGIFYSGEGYVMRWSYVITVVRELEGLTPGEGMFAKDRKYQKNLLEKQLQKQISASQGQGREVDTQLSKIQSEKNKKADDSSDEDVNESDEESRRVLESGGRDRVAYFFWQGEHASINEKGAAAVITVELDKERAPQIRVTQGKEHPAFLQLFNGSMIILCGKSESNPIEKCNNRGYRLYCVLGNVKKEACLVEIDVQKSSIFYYMRSRGCYIIQHKATSCLYVWNGCKATDALKGVAALAGRKLKKRLKNFKVVSISEGAEPNELSKLMGERSLYNSLLEVPEPVSYTPRLFHMSSSTGWFIASEETHISMPDSADTPDPFGFLQEDLYHANQPGLFLFDANTDIYLWMGWWPIQKNKLLREKNAFSGQAQSRWAKEKKLALETALSYADASKRTPRPNVYVVQAGSENIEFINLFPIWNERKDVQEIVGNLTPTRVSAEKELAKYNRKSYSLQELLKRPEEVDPSKLETYLSDEEFERLFKMPREQFAKMLSWKQVELKKKVGLF